MKLNFVEGINLALEHSLSIHEKVLVFGLGVNDPGRVFGSTTNLLEKFGKKRVFEIPLSENAVTGMALGLALNGYRPVMIHQRADFAFTAAEQIINQIAKTSYTTAGVYEVPLVIRMLVGRGWGQGPTHSQAPHGIYAQIPGLRVIMPSTPSDGYHLLKEAIDTNQPTIFIEHRWLHGLTEDFEIEPKEKTYPKVRTLARGKDLTIISVSYGAIEALKISQIFKSIGINVEVLSVVSLQPLEMQVIYESVALSKKVVILDVSHLEYGITAELSRKIYTNHFNNLKAPILSFGLDFLPTPSSPLLSLKHYPSIKNMALSINKHFAFNIDENVLLKEIKRIDRNGSKLGDQPEFGSVGPF